MKAHKKQRGMVLNLSAKPVTIQAAEGAATPSTFTMNAYTGEPLDLGPWDSPVVVDLGTIDLSQQTIPALYDHCPDVDYVVGQVQSVKVENGALIATGKIIVTADASGRNLAKTILDKAKAGYQWQASIGGTPATTEVIPAGKDVQVNGRTYAGPVVVARGVKLQEISFVVLGADRKTSVVVARKKIIKGSAMSFEDWLLSMGFADQSALDEVQLANLKQVYADKYGESDAETAKAADTETTDEEMAAAETADEEMEADDDEKPMPTNAAARRAKIKAKLAAKAGTQKERLRVATIQKLCADHGNPKLKVRGQKVKLEQHAITAGWSPDAVKAKLLEQKRAKRPKGPNVIASNNSKPTLQALQGAYILKFGGRLDHKSYGSQQAVAMGIPAWLRAGINDSTRNQIMEASHRFSDLSAVDLCRQCLMIEGKNVPHSRNEMIRAAFSGSALSSVFTTNVNAILLSSYFEVGDTTMGWVTENEVADYQLQERPRVVVGDGLSKLPENGMADHASFADKVEQYKVNRFAKQFQIDEIAVINDRLGVFMEVPKKFGEAAAWLRPDLVYAHLMSNPTLAATARAMFNATDANLKTTAALAAGTIKAAISAQSLFQENGRNLNLKTTHLIVPPTLLWTAKELIYSTDIQIAGTAGTVTERGNINTIQGENLTIVVDSRLENGVTDPDTRTNYAGSPSTWYVASRFAHTIEVGYLRGTGRAPQVRNFVLDKGQFGMGWDVQMAVGCKALDWRGMVKNTA
ncbi:MAG: hypothetical protein ACRDD1_18090 [Planctomycetia bacterium]